MPPLTTRSNLTGAVWWLGRLGGGMGSAQVDTIVLGQLIVDIADPKAKQFLWRGTANDTVSDKPDKNQKNLTKALNKMFQNFPSGGK